MTTNPDTTAHGRVVVAVTDPGAADELFELGLRLAARRQHHLLALVREASELATAGALPFVHEIDRCTGTLRPFDSAAAARAMTRLARDCEQRLTDLAAARRVHAAVERVRGRLLAAALSAHAKGDLLLLGGASAHAVLGPGRTPAPRRVGVVTNGDDDDRAALAVADELGSLNPARAPGPALVQLHAPPALVQAAAAVDILVLSRRRAEADAAGLQHLLRLPRRLVVIVSP